MKVKSGMIWSLLLASLTYAQTEPKASQEAKRAAPSVEEILTRLEKRSDGLKDIRCKIHFVEDDQMNLTKQTKDGLILLLMGGPNPKFMIHFERSQRAEDLVALHVNIGRLRAHCFVAGRDAGRNMQGFFECAV